MEVYTTCQHKNNHDMCFIQCIRMTKMGIFKNWPVKVAAVYSLILNQLYIWQGLTIALVMKTFTKKMCFSLHRFTLPDKSWILSSCLQWVLFNTSFWGSDILNIANMCFSIMLGRVWLKFPTLVSMHIYLYWCCNDHQRYRHDQN